MIWEQVKRGIEAGNAVIAWSAPNDAGFDFDTCGQNRRRPIDFDGLRLVAFSSVSSAVNFLCLWAIRYRRQMATGFVQVLSEHNVR